MYSLLELRHRSSCYPSTPSIGLGSPQTGSLLLSGTTIRIYPDGTPFTTVHYNINILMKILISVPFPTVFGPLMGFDSLHCVPSLFLS